MPGFRQLTQGCGQGGCQECSTLAGQVPSNHRLPCQCHTVCSDSLWLNLLTSKPTRKPFIFLVAKPKSCRTQQNQTGGNLGLSLKYRWASPYLVAGITASWEGPAKFSLEPYTLVSSKVNSPHPPTEHSPPSLKPVEKKEQPACPKC